MASVFSLVTSNASALVFSGLTIAVVAGVALLVVVYGLSAVLMLIISYGD